MGQQESNVSGGIHYLILEFCDWKERGYLMCLSKVWGKMLSTKSLSFNRFLCSRLSIENGVYSPTNHANNMCHTAEDLFNLFLELFKIKDIWTDKSVLSILNNNENTYSKVGERFKIEVFAKFCPILKSDATDLLLNNSANIVTLPLYQRLSMIKMSHNLMSNKAALRVLAEEGGWFKEKWESIAKEEDFSFQDFNNENMDNNKTFYTSQNNSKKLLNSTRERIKQSDKSNSVNRLSACVQSIDQMNGRVVVVAPDVGLRNFTFDAVLPSKVSQKYTYEVAVKRLVMDFINGFNATTIVYGQTGSGKSYSMFGSDDASIYGETNNNNVSVMCYFVIF